MEKNSDIDNQETQLNNPNITIDKTQEEHTPKLFSDENNHADDQSDYYKEEEVSERLFDQDVNEEEDFEIPAFFKTTKVLMIKYQINEHSKIITGIFPFSSDVERDY